MLRRIIFGLLVLSLCVPAQAVWYNASWGHRKLITVQSDATGFTTDLPGHPVYVPLVADANVGADCNALGHDIRFTLSDGTTLCSYERPVFAVADGNATGHFFVKASLESDDGSPTTLWMYYGNDGVADGQSITATWDANFVMVMHLEETSGNHLDSTSNNNDSNVVSVTTQGSYAGIVGGSDDFDGSNDYIRVPDDDTLDGWAAFTIEAWVKKPFKSGDGYQRIYDKLDGTAWLIYIGGGAGTTGATSIDMQTAGTGAGSAVLSLGSVAANTWQYVAATWIGGDDTIIRPYLNGVAGTTGARAGDTMGNSARDLYIGDSAAGDKSFEDGLDELRISNIARPASYFAFVNAQFTSGDNELTWGTEEDYSAPSPGGTATGKAIRIIQQRRQ